MSWFVGVPFESSREDALRVISKRLEKEGSRVFPVDLPPLRIGTLDSLLALSDELSRHESMMEMVVGKVFRNLVDVSSISEEPEITLPDGTTMPASAYVTRFKWDAAQFSTGKPLPELTKQLVENVTKIDEEMRLKLADFMSVRGALSNIVRKESGTLMVRNLQGVVKPEDFIHTEYLTTVLVVVPKYMYKDWHATYETLGGIEYVAPRSTKLLEEDAEFGLFRVVVLKKVADDYCNACRENRFNVRDYQVGGEDEGSSGNQKEHLEAEMEKMTGSLSRFCMTSFSIAFTSLMHLKAVRLFTEAILRYGLPPKFVACIVVPARKKEMKTIESIGQITLSLQGKMVKKAIVTEEMGDIFGPSGAVDMLPFIFLKVNQTWK
uniref:V-type proton ATPase subunit C n=1 Tax=Stygiella incarcerata TaxID=1712417 RepID=A0A192ZI90_9EUKA|nr:V-type proton ATPase subunit C [Stygiella incarcerata]|eukprot:TRINITY_DN1080_c0_g1_i1.p1 TRINITY_DN1080_c0_g1~~TRINITY_DN1080_c0_g1_i1.p1  ORF type:complete len:379 (-),score=98.48 TRINITY_DN1080_c0_g1_i1:243-1379(-)